MNKISFLQGFLRSPLEVGSIIPSSRFMVNRVAKHVKTIQPKTIIELGAGTGVLTEALYGVKDEKTQFIAFEKDDAMRGQLEDKYKDIDILEDAFYLPQVLRQREMKEVDCIVCGLPLSLFSPEKTEELFQYIDQSLHPDGLFIMYQYTTHLRKKLIERFAKVRTEYVLLNIPPTFVYICQK
jgi:phospholipid N-methyltransferase